jgi:tRNA (mo5U34)-methyltransferase
MNIEEIRNNQNKKLTWKNVKPMRQALENIQFLKEKEFDFILDDWVTIQNKLSDQEYKILQENAKVLIPWRKGPFNLCGLEIDSEWQSNKKYNLLRPYFNLKDKIVADVGCNNAYYMFRMLEDKPKKLVGFDPSALFKTQFEFVNTFIKSDIVYELMGVEHMEHYEHKFDFIFMLGVLYHRSDPVSTLKALRNSLNPNGEVIVDSFMIDGEDEVSLTPHDRYSLIPNIYFIPTINCFKNWLNRAGFKDIEVLEITQTDSEEQRVTSWSFEVSLSEMLDSNDKSKTIEGYPAPKRVYLKAKKK